MKILKILALPVLFIFGISGYFIVNNDNEVQVAIKHSQVASDTVETELPPATMGSNKKNDGIEFSSIENHAKQPEQNPQQSVGEQFDRLLEVDDNINTKNEEYIALIKEYDQDLSNQETKSKLSTSLLNDKQYRDEIIEKFKIEKELNDL